MPAEYSLFKDEVSLGRGEDNDVVIPHASVSRAHARLMRRNGVFELMDLNSTNGSYVNEQPVQGSVRVANGNQVRLGDVRLSCCATAARAVGLQMPVTSRKALDGGTLRDAPPLRLLRPALCPSLSLV